MKKPTKAIICAAGLGTRFLPFTKAIPKEMLPIVDKPVIQLLVEDAIAAGVTDIIIVTNSSKKAIEDHFDYDTALEADLRASGKDDKADQIRQIAEMANFIYLRQKGLPKGNARPVLNARHLIGDDEPFFVFYADDYFSSKVPRAKQLLKAYQKTGKTIISLITGARKDADKYGIAAIGDIDKDKTCLIKEIVEKPGVDKAPSDYGSVSGYLLTPEIWPLLAQEKTGVGGEIIVAESINELAKTDQVYGQVVDGKFQDTGNPLKYAQVVVDETLADERYGAEFREYLKKIDL